MLRVKRLAVTRRGFLSAAAAVATGSLLAACAPKAGEAPTAAPVQPTAVAATEVPAATAPPTAPEPTAAQGKPITFLDGWGGDYTTKTWPALQETAEFKEALGPDTFELLQGTSESLLTSISAGTPPDGAANRDWLSLMVRGVLYPVDDLVANSKIISKDLYFPAIWNDSFYKGQQLGVPAHDGFVRYGLCYNSRLVEEVGLDPAKPPLTWEETFEWHKKLTKFDSAGNLLRIGLDPYDAMGGSNFIENGFFPAVSWGFEWFDESTNEFNLDCQEMVESLEVMGEFIKFAGPDKFAGLRQVEGNGTWGGSYATEVQAMMIDGYWRPGMTFNEKPEVGKYNLSSWVPVPSSRAGVKAQGTGTCLTIIFKDAVNPQGMYRIAEFLSTKAACQVIFDTVGWLPGIPSFVETIDKNKYPGLPFFMDSVKEANEWSTPARCPVTPFAEQVWIEVREKVYRGELSAADAARQMQERCANELQNLGL